MITNTDRILLADVMFYGGACYLPQLQDFTVSRVDHAVLCGWLTRDGNALHITDKGRAAARLAS
jgi:hypothetical protein